VSIKKALVTPDDDEGIEVMINMRPSTFASAESKVGGTRWDFGVSSIDRDGVKKEHMAGSISINASPRSKTPHETPQFHQRASGRAWNQALREVGFDYGPTFQDMDNVRFDGHSYQASCTTNTETAVASYSNAKVLQVDLQQKNGIEAQGIKATSHDIVALSGGVKDESQLRKYLKPAGLTTWSAPTSPAALIVMGYADLKRTIINTAGVGMNRGIVLDQAATNGITHTSTKSPEVQIVYRKYACDVSAVIKATFEALSWQVKLRKLSDCDKEVGAEHVIMLDNMDGPLLLTMTETEFEAIKTIA